MDGLQVRPHLGQRPADLVEDLGMRRVNGQGVPARLDHSGRAETRHQALPRSPLGARRIGCEKKEDREAEEQG